MVISQNQYHSILITLYLELIYIIHKAGRNCVEKEVNGTIFM